MVPLRANTLKLERVIEEARIWNQTARKVASAKDVERLWSWNSVHVGDDHDVAQSRGARIGAEQFGKDLLVAGVTLKVLKIPGTLWTEATRKLELLVEVVVLGKAVPALFC